MSSTDLNSTQKTILTTLVDLSREAENAVKSGDIAEEADRNPGTIRNQMQALKALQLVEGIPGPKGGYKPTAAAYEALNVERFDQSADVPLVRNGERVESVTVDEIEFTSVHDPDLCHAEVHIHGSVRDFHEGDTIKLGPTPPSKLVVSGTVDGKDETSGVVNLRVEDLEAPIEASKHSA